MKPFVFGRVPLFLAGSIALLFACGGREQGIIDDSSGAGSCQGSPYSYCDGNGDIINACCGTGDPCAPPPVYCALDNGRCTQGTCANGNGRTENGNGGDDVDASLGADASVVDADVTETPCGAIICVSSQTCVVTTTGGGPCLMPDDGGLCPNGQPSNGQCCNTTATSYECKTTPANCGGSGLACSCAESLCECGGCALAQAPNTVQCACEAP